MEDFDVTNVRKDERPTSVICEFDLTIKKIELLIRDCKLIQGAQNNFIAMPSRKKFQSNPPEYYQVIEWGQKQKIHLQNKVTPIVEKAFKELYG